MATEGTGDRRGLDVTLSVGLTVADQKRVRLAAYLTEETVSAFIRAAAIKRAASVIRRAGITADR